MSNECIHAHSNLAKSGIWSIDCEIWDMGYWGVKNLGYGILGGKKIWDMGYGHPCVTPPPPTHIPDLLLIVMDDAIVYMHF